MFGNIAPGALAGHAARVVQQRGHASSAPRARPWNLGDFGFDLGGPILKDKLWFYVGVAPSFTRFQRGAAAAAR